MSAGVLTWLIALSLFIYVLFGTPSTQPLCDRNWANVAPDWVYWSKAGRPSMVWHVALRHHQGPLNLATCYASTVVLPDHLHQTRVTETSWKGSILRIFVRAQVICVLWCGPISPDVYWERTAYPHVYTVHIWLHALTTQSRGLIPLVAHLNAFLFTWRWIKSSVWVLFLNPSQTRVYQVSCTLAFLGCWPVHSSSELWKEKPSRKSLLSRNVTVHVILCI